MRLLKTLLKIYVISATVIVTGFLLLLLVVAVDNRFAYVELPNGVTLYKQSTWRLAMMKTENGTVIFPSGVERIVWDDDHVAGWRFLSDKEMEGRPPPSYDCFIVTLTDTAPGFEKKLFPACQSGYYEALDRLGLPRRMQIPENSFTEQSIAELWQTPGYRHSWLGDRLWED